MPGMSRREPNPGERTGPRPEAVGWADAPERILHALALRQPGRVLGVTGPVASGKSTLASRVADLARSRLGLRVALVPTDNYLPDYDPLPEDERDEPRHADLALLAAHLATLRAGERVEMPEWCFQRHRRVGERPVGPAELIVCEGIFALHETVAPHTDLGVFVEAPAAARWARWAQIEASGERGWGVERARAYFERVADPTFARHAPAYLARADMVVRNRPDDASDRPARPAQGAANPPTERED